MLIFPLTLCFYNLFCSGIHRHQIFLRVFGQENDLLLKALPFFNFSFAFPLFPFLSFAAVINLLLGLLPVQKLQRKHHQVGQFLPWSSHGCVVAGNFALSSSLKFLCIVVHISGAIKLITLIWVSLERSFPPAEVEYR